MNGAYFGITDLKTRFVLLSQEQEAQTKSLSEFRLAQGAILQELKRLERRIATLEAVHCAGSIQGLDGEIRVSFPEEWGGMVPLVEVRDNAESE